MYCPDCLSPNLPAREACNSCGADLRGQRERFAVGAQFLFADASERQPLAISLDGASPTLLTRPSAFSRHRHSIELGEYDKGKPEARQRMGLPRLDAPRRPDLAAVITERKIYRPKEEAHVFVVVPDAPGEEVTLEVQLAGQQISRQKLQLDEWGLALHPCADLEEGEYTVLVHRRRAGQEEPAQCTFSVAEFSLSPLIALLERHTYRDGELAFRLRVQALSIPYRGAVELGLQDAAAGNRVVETKKAEVEDGLLEASFDVSHHGGPFHLQVTTPDGETATVFFPGTGKTERERITLCLLGRVAEAGLLPGEETQELRGLHIGYDGQENTPLRLESAVDRSGRLVVEVPAAVLQIVAFNPYSGEATAAEFRDLKAGDGVEFPVEAPYTLFTVAMMAPRLPYEAWGVVVHPAEVKAQISAPESATPGDEIVVRIESSRPAACLLLAYDARMEHESPVPKLGKRLMDAIRATTGSLKEQVAWPWARWRPWAPFEYLGDGALRSMSMGAPVPKGLGRAMLEEIPVGTAEKPAFLRRRPSGRQEAGGGSVPEVAEVETLTFVTAPSREDFPELAYLELFRIEDVAERVVPLGDQIGTWRCRAYLVAGLDILELTADVEAAKAVYAELDLPAIVGAGDDILASVRYHTRQAATMTITLPDGQSIGGAVMGHGTERFHLTGAGDVTVHIASPEGEDWTVRTVRPPGVQTVTASSLEILKRGETVHGDRVVVYPGPADVLSDTIEALGRYPFG